MHVQVEEPEVDELPARHDRHVVAPLRLYVLAGHAVTETTVCIATI